MIEMRGRECKTSFVRFSHLERDDILFLSMSHFGTPEYFRLVQEIINTHEGLIVYEFAETIDGKPPFREEVEPESNPETSPNKITASIFGLLSQSEALALPQSNVYAPNYTLEEITKFEPALSEAMQKLETGQERFRKLFRILHTHPGIGKTLLHFFLACSYRSDVSPIPWWSKEGLIVGGKREKDFFQYLERLAKRGFSAQEKETIVALSIFGRIPDPLLYDFYVVFREKKLLELLSQTQSRGAPLVVYGGGHYYNVARKLRILGYSSTTIRKLSAFPIMKVEINVFLEALHTLMSLL